MSTLVGPLVSLTTNDQTTLPNGAFKVDALHVSLLSDMLVSADIASVTVGPNTDVTTPDAPINLTATPGNGSATLTRKAPASNGGSPVLGYSVYMGTTPGGESSTPVNGATLVPRLGLEVSGLTNGTTYYVVVKGVDAQGESAVSNGASATPSSAACPAPFIDVPSTSPFCLDMKWLKDNGIAYGADGEFDPSGTAVRQAMAAFVHRMATVV